MPLGDWIKMGDCVFFSLFKTSEVTRPPVLAVFLKTTKEDIWEQLTKLKFWWML